MNGCEKLIQLMRQQGAMGNPSNLELGEMLSETTCRIGGNDLEKEDLIVAEHLTAEYGIKASASIEATIDGKKTNAKIEEQTMSINNKLKKGDTVLTYRVGEDKYAIIERMVSL